MASVGYNDVQHKEFANRIARIESGKGSFRSTIFVGQDQKIRPEKLSSTIRKTAAKMTTQVAVQDKPTNFVRGFLLMPVAFVVGCAALILWRMAEFHLPGFGFGFGDPVQIFALTTATGMALAIMLCQATGLTAPQHMLFAFLGVLAMMLGLHNLVHLAPDQFAQIFSPAWVNGTLIATPPNSVTFAGTFYPILG